MKKKIAVIGSSGGHLFVLGGKDAQGLLDEIVRQAEAGGFEVSHIAFVAASTSMDHVTKDTTAVLWTQDETGPKAGETVSLEEANRLAEAESARIARAIRSGEVDALIMVSADPKGINKEVVVAAAEKKIPVAGTGGSSMADARAMGANVVSASGTTGSTNRTRAIGYISAFASVWKTKYTPVIGKATAIESGDVWKRINFRSIMMSSLPGFIAMALILAIGKIPFLSSSVGPLFDTLIGALPVIVAVVAAKQVSGLEEVGIVAGVVAGVLSVNGGILGGIVGGILAGILANYLLNWSFRMRFPTTTASLVAGAISGLVSGLLIYFVLAPITLWAGNGVRALIDAALAFNAILAGAVAGLLIWPAIIGGVYHAAILPIVLLEMEKTGNSFLGAIDMCGLVMVSAGITLANIIAPREKSEASLAAPGFLVNVGFGTFVEAAYPFMFADKRIFGTALFAAMVSGAFAGFFNARGTAYVPSIVAPTLSNNPVGFLISMLVALGTACVLTVIFNKTAKKKEVVEE
jgi:fructose-specific phosphotransferase system IIC component